MVLGTSGPMIAHDAEYYLKTRDQIRLLCEASIRDGNIRYEDIYNLLPDRDYESRALRFGYRQKADTATYQGDLGAFQRDNPSLVVDKWVWLEEDEEGKKCAEILRNTTENTPVRTIYDRIKRVINHAHYEMGSIIPVSRSNWGKPWPSYSHLFDIKLAPSPPGFKFQFSNSEDKRRAEFRALIKSDSKDYLERIILFVTFSNTGAYLELEHKNLNHQYFIDGTGFRHATKEELADLPNWYLAWNRVMPMLCTRYNNWGPVVQKGCRWINTDD